MTTLALAFIAGITALGFIVVFQIEHKKTRRRRLEGLELRPNCLLTRYPIAFVSGRRSVFRLFDHWNEVPSYLREHGYEVLLLEPAAKDGAQSLLAALDDLGGKCHIIADSSSRDALERMASIDHPNVVSLTLICNPTKTTQPARLAPSDLRPLKKVVEIFELRPPALASGVADWLALRLLRAHNVLVLGRGQMVDALETAELSSREHWAIEGRFLELAISLAERDAHGD